MTSKSSVEIADRYSRKRAILVAVAALAFLAIQLVGRPVFVGDAAASPRVSLQYWAINVIALLLTLATGGGLLNRRQIRALVNDDVARQHYSTAIKAGYWVAMTIAMALYILPVSQGFTVREAVYLIVTPVTLVALLTFSYLEFRAHGAE